MKPKKNHQLVVNNETSKFAIMRHDLKMRQRAKEARMIIVDMAKAGSTPEEIRIWLEAGGYYNKAGNAYGRESIKQILRESRMVEKRNTPPAEPKPEPIGREEGVEPIDFQRKGKERPNILKIAYGVLMGRFKWDDTGYHLRKGGKWVQASLYEVMRLTNTELNRQRLPQIDVNPNWVVK